MALQSVGSYIQIPTKVIDNGGNSGYSVVNATTVSLANGGWGGTFVVGKTGTLDRIGLYLNTVTTPGTLNFSFQTVSSGLPTGTAYGGSGTVAVAVTGTGWWEASGLNASATAGDVIAFCIRNDATLTGNYANARISASQIQPLFANGPSPLVNNGSVWSFDDPTGTYLAAVGYSSTDYSSSVAQYWTPISAVGTVSISTSAAAKRWGAKFTPAFKLRAKGIAFRTTGSNVSSCTVVIYDSAGTTALATGTHTASNYRVVYTSNTINGTFVPFDSGATFTMSAGTTYRIAVVPSTTSTMSMPNITANSAGLLSALPLGNNWLQTTYDGSTWTDTSTVYPVGLWLMVDQLDDGAGGGTSGIIVPPGINGGITQ